MNNILRRESRPLWAWILAFLALTVWGLTDVRSRGRIDATDVLAHKTDLTCYTEAAKAFFDGRNPYEVVNPRGWRYLYPPLFAILLAPLAQFDSQTQVVIWFFFNLLLLWGCNRESTRIEHLIRGLSAAEPTLAARAKTDATWTSTADRSPPPDWLTWIADLTMTLPVLSTLQHGQVGILLAYLLLLGFRLVAGSVSWRGAALGGIALAAAVNLKLTPALPTLLLIGVLVLIAARSGWARDRIERAGGTLAGAVLGLALFFLLLPAAAVGWNANLHHLGTWVGKVVFNSDLGGDNDLSFRSIRNQSLVNAASRLGNWTMYAFAGGPNDEPYPETDSQAPGTLAKGPAAAATPMPMEGPATKISLAVARLGILLLLAVVGWRAGRAGTTLDLAAAFGMACTATLLVSPLSWAHHYLVCIPALLAVPLWLWRHGWTGMAKGLAVGACALMWTHYLLLDWAGRAGVLGLGTTAWFIVAAIWMLSGSAPRGQNSQLDATAANGISPKAKAA